MRINNCEYWGNYDNREVYKCYGNVIEISRMYGEYLFASGNIIYRNGYKVGMLQGDRVLNYDADKPEREKKKKELENKTRRVSEENLLEVDNAQLIEDLFKKVMERTVEDLVGKRFSSE